jgi:hypothetical protein
MTIAELPYQPHHANEDLGIGEARNITVKISHDTIDVRLGLKPERRVRPSLDLPGKKR